jgi:hypothetical protein
MQMKRPIGITVILFACWISQGGLGVAATAQEQRLRVAEEGTGTAVATKPGTAGGASGELLVGNRRPLYRILQRMFAFNQAICFLSPKTGSRRSGSFCRLRV